MPGLTRKPLPYKARLTFDLPIEEADQIRTFCRLRKCTLTLLFRTMMRIAILSDIGKTRLCAAGQQCPFNNDITAWWLSVANDPMESDPDAPQD